MTVRVSVTLPGARAAPGAEPPPTGRTSRPVRFGEEPEPAAVIRGAVDEVTGPAVCELPEATLLVRPGWCGRADAEGTVVLERR